MTKPNPWKQFTEYLAECLGSLSAGDFLIVDQKSTITYVQFAVGGEEGTRVEAVSNDYRPPPGVQLTKRQYATMKRMGWNHPTFSSAASDPDAGERAPSNFFVDFPVGTDLTQIAALAVHALEKVYRIQALDTLEYYAFGSYGAIDLPGSGAGHGSNFPTEAVYIWVDGKVMSLSSFLDDFLR